MNKIIGYQVVMYNDKTKKYDALPDGILSYSFVVIRKLSKAIAYANELACNTRIKNIYVGDIEDPTFV